MRGTEEVEVSKRLSGRREDVFKKSRLDLERAWSEWPLQPSEESAMHPAPATADRLV